MLITALLLRLWAAVLLTEKPRGYLSDQKYQAKASTLHDPGKKVFKCTTC